MLFTPPPILPLPCLQFGLTPILDYLTHQRRLFPALAATYAMHLAMLQLKQIVVKVGGYGWSGWGVPCGCR